MKNTIELNIANGHKVKDYRRVYVKGFTVEQLMAEIHDQTQVAFDDSNGKQVCYIAIENVNDLLQHLQRRRVANMSSWLSNAFEMMDNRRDFLLA